MKIVDINQLRKKMDNVKKPNAVILVFSESCGHCVALMPEWKKLEMEVKRDHRLKSQPECYISKVESQNASMFPEMQPETIRGVPTIKFLNEGVLSGDYEEASQPRNAENILNWIHSKLKNKTKNKSKTKHTHKEEDPITMDIVEPSLIHSKYKSSGNNSVDEVDIDNDADADADTSQSYDSIKPFTITNSVISEASVDSQKKSRSKTKKRKRKPKTIKKRRKRSQRQSGGWRPLSPRKTPRSRGKKK